MRITLLLCVLFLCSCAVKTRQVLMVPRKEEAGVVKLYFDREGKLYPPDVRINPHYFYLEHLHKKSLSRYSNPEYATLETALTKYDSISRDAMRQEFNLMGVDSIRLFLRLQDAVRKNIISEIEQKIKSTSSNDLIVLIHGFNDPIPDAAYYSLRKNIEKYLQVKPVFIEVYWDGLTSLGDNPVFSNIWGYAQSNSAKVGLGLRNILNKLNQNIRLTILTHSLGASVATHALFNPGKWPKKFQEELENEYHSENIPTPKQKDIRIAMIAPAIPGIKVFDHIDYTIPENTVPTITRVVIGYNHFDYAVTKGGLFASAFGSTALGANDKNEVNKTIIAINEINPKIKVIPVDFSLYVKNDSLSNKKLQRKSPFKQREHGVQFYEQNQHFADFLKAMFD
jgi:hypothetical protein